MAKTNPRTVARAKRVRRIRKKISGTSERPRLRVFKSNKHIYAQIINDATGQTLAEASTLSKEIQGDPDKKTKSETAVSVGKLIAERAIEKGIKKVVFDRNGFLYHGRIKAISDGAREAGLDF
jgi:large subunit ribosomal protein L18